MSLHQAIKFIEHKLSTWRCLWAVVFSKKIFQKKANSVGETSHVLLVTLANVFGLSTQLSRLVVSLFNETSQTISWQLLVLLTKLINRQFRKWGMSPYGVGRPAYNLIMGRSAIFKMADQSTINFILVGGHRPFTKVSIVQILSVMTASSWKKETYCYKVFHRWNQYNWKKTQRRWKYLIYMVYSVFVYSVFVMVYSVCALALSQWWSWSNRWRYGMAIWQVWPCKALAWEFGGRLPGLTMQSRMARLCHGMATCCQITGYDSWEPSPAPGQTSVELVLHGSCRYVQRGPHAKPPA